MKCLSPIIKLEAWILSREEKRFWSVNYFAWSLNHFYITGLYHFGEVIAESPTVIIKFRDWKS